MTKAEAQKRIDKLRPLLERYWREYYVNDQPSVDDAVYDTLNAELKSIERAYPELADPNSPLNKVGGEVNAKFQATPHDVPMLSINDIFDMAELEAWEARLHKLLGKTDIEYYGELKMDGLAMRLVYRGGKFVQAVTRGDGRVGEDVTHTVGPLPSVPRALKKTAKAPQAVYDYFEIRGEVVFPKAEFARLNSERSAAGLPLFANPRNAGAGSVRQLDPTVAASRGLQFIAYSIEMDLPELVTHKDEHELARHLGFVVEPHDEVLKDMAAIKKFIEKWEQKRQKLAFGTDGLVINVNSNADFARLGVVGKAPRGAAAFKYPAEQATTILEDIRVNVGRTGAVTPFAVLTPVVIAGSTVSRATLHNEDEIKRKDIRVGDTVIVQKAGDIIPEVVASLPKLRTGREKIWHMPKAINGVAVVKPEGEAVARLADLTTSEVRWQGLIHFVSKSAFDIEGLGEQTLAQLMEAGLVNTAVDIFKLQKSELLELEGFQETSAQNLINSIKQHARVSLARFIFALGIRHVGAITARDIAKRLVTLEAFMTAGPDDFEAIEGIGEVVRASLEKWLSHQANAQLVQDLLAAGVVVEPEQVSSGPLVGKNFVITGTLESFSREVAGQKIEAMGGQLQSAVTKDTSYVVVGDDPGASKLAKARKLGTPVITESEFLKLI